MKKIINNLNRLETKFDKQKAYIANLQDELNHISMENRNFAEFLDYKGYTPDEISDIAYGSYNRTQESIHDEKLRAHFENKGTLCKLN